MIVSTLLLAIASVTLARKGIHKTNPILAMYPSTEVDLGDGYTSSKLNFTHHSPNGLFKTHMHFDSERRNDVIDLMDYNDISDVSCVGKEVLLHFTSPLALHRTIKALYGHSILYINPVWMCSGGSIRRIVRLDHDFSRHTAEALIVTVITEAGSITDAYRKLEFLLESNDPAMLESDNIVGGEWDYNGTAWNDSFVETYPNDPSLYSVVLTFNPSLYIEISVPETFDIPTGINSMNITFTGYIDANLTLGGTFEGSNSTAPYQFFNYKILVEPLAYLDVNVEISADVVISYDVTSNIVMEASVAAGGDITLGVAYNPALYSGGFNGVATEDFGYNYFITPFQGGQGSGIVSVSLIPHVDLTAAFDVIEAGFEAPFTLQASVSTTDLENIDFDLFYEVNATASVGISPLEYDWNDNLVGKTLLWSCSWEAGTC